MWGEAGWRAFENSLYYILQSCCNVKILFHILKTTIKKYMWGGFYFTNDCH